MSKLAEVTDQNFDAEVLKAPAALVDFWAEWWGGCKQIAPVVEQLARDYAGKVKIVGANVDVAGDTASSLGILSIPALVFFKGGKEVARLGPAPRQKIADEIKRAFGV